MIPWTQLGLADIPDNGGQLKLTQRGDEFSIHLVGVRGELMNSRVHSSEEALAELACNHLKSVNQARVLVGGLGMGFTLAAALKSVNSSSTVVVAELIPEVENWNRGPLGNCAGRPLDDPRTQVHIGDVAELFSNPKQNEQHTKFDSILLDVDNGPEGFTHADNQDLYSINSLKSIYQTLRAKGVLAVWSAWYDPKFTTQLKRAGFKVTNKTVRAHKGKGSRHTIYLARK